ncbi:glucose/mannose transport system permease protein [Halogranum gelatinilyticum]|uniref:Glucose/mannose transport system permease protein n=1 Tax=Halogranum gelatinilyticum TaxID=660521 RepID=A0A1G9SL20_9EURY|nr:carbohydrate ABC transporter permease [Halogranum gelatinilyticum]SDM36178.1 glucose/mannose transport system permease protein [Halogranum gelatinilyticum]
MSTSFDPKQLDLGRVSVYAVLLVMVAFYLSPLETGLMTALKTQDAFFSTTPFAPPPAGGFTFEPWGNAFDRLAPGLFNSLLFAVPATVLSALFGSMAAYGMTNLNWKYQVGVLSLFVAGVFIPYQSVLVPLTRFWAMVDVASLLSFIPFVAERAGLVELAVTHTAYGIPICTVLFRGYYLSLDTEMLEAARLDGATPARIYRKIVLPLSKPMFAVALIYQFTNIWNDLLFALVLVSDPANAPVTIALNTLKGSMVQQYNVQMAGAFVAALPTLVIYVLFGEQFAKGVAGET